jgi:hypothetical protein
MVGRNGNGRGAATRSASSWMSYTTTPSIGRARSLATCAATIASSVGRRRQPAAQPVGTMPASRGDLLVKGHQKNFTTERGGAGRSNSLV